MNRLFISSGYSDSHTLMLESGDSLTLTDLPPFLRVLLTTDGTVTKSLESYFWESVSVVKVRQLREPLVKPLMSINSSLGREMITRDVYLQGDKTQRIYAYAHSFIFPDALPTSICSDLEQDKVGIGEVLRECSLETYRELIRIGKEVQEGETLITRTYRIVMGGIPCIEIY